MSRSFFTGYMVGLCAALLIEVGIVAVKAQAERGGDTVRSWIMMQYKAHRRLEPVDVRVIDGGPVCLYVVDAPDTSADSSPQIAVWGVPKAAPGMPGRCQ